MLLLLAFQKKKVTSVATKFTGNRTWLSVQVHANGDTDEKPVFVKLKGFGKSFRKMPPTSGDMEPSSGGSRPKSNTIVFDASKNELYKINDSYKSLHRKLKGTIFLKMDSGFGLLGFKTMTFSDFSSI